ncbi:MAG: TonB C-terminal domain-containing protein [Methylococcales bacterium]|nr:TonB C-terminal domain-containing protein [Methylococcales bacterium]
MEEKKFAWLRRLPVLLGVGSVLLIVVGIIVLKDLFPKPPHAKKVAQQITMIQPPPPPPPPPEVKPPEPEVKEEKIEEPEPEPEPEPTPEESNEPPAEELGLDADGAAGADGFGLAARKGGRSILGGGGGNAVIWYGGQIINHLQDDLQSALEDLPAISSAKSGCSVVVSVWVSPEGSINRTELTSGSGQTEVDQTIRAALLKVHSSLGKAPPESMHQPAKVRIKCELLLNK